MLYKNLFFDLDDTLWAFSVNAQSTFFEMYQKHRYGRFFPSFEHFYQLYQQRNHQLWIDYAAGKVTKDELNRQRFVYPLQVVGVPQAEAIAKDFANDFFQVIPTKSEVIPHAHEVLAELATRYNLYILSNGFHELQRHKMSSAGLDIYFKDVILSDDIGILKPDARLFHHALKVANATVGDSLMIGDSWESDVVGASSVGMHQVYFSPNADASSLPFTATYFITDFRQLLEIL